MSEDDNKMARAEWIAAAAIVLNVLTLVFGGGAFWQTVQDHERRVAILENIDKSRQDALTQILIRLERIDTNTIALKERMDKGGDK